MRIAALDRLRIVIVMLLIPYHTARGFDSVAFYFKNDAVRGDAARVWELANRTFEVFAMPTLFMIAGIAFATSLEIRGARGLVAERVRRLGIPLIFGTLLLIPFVGWVADRGSDSFWAYLPRFFEITDLTGFDGRFTPSQLWFLIFLLLFTPIGIVLARPMARLGEWAATAAISIWIVGAGIIIISTRLLGLPYPSPTYFLAFFLVGLALGGAPAALRRTERIWPIAAIVAVFLVPAYLALRDEIVFGAGRAILAERWPWVAYQAGYALAAWTTSLALIGASRRYLGGKSGSLGAWSEAAMIVYVAHMTALVLIASALAPHVGASPLMHWALTVALSTIVLVLATLVIRTSDTLRFLFGLRGKQHSVAGSQS